MILDDTHGYITIYEGAYIEDTAVIIGPCEIESDCYIGHCTVVGAPPQYHGVFPSPVTAERRAKGVVVCARATVREFCQIHQGIVDVTLIGQDVLLMAGCHIAHDSYVGRDSTIGSFSIFGGHTHVGERVTFGQGVVTHPWVVVGEGAMIGLNSSVTKDVLPYQKVAGSPARLLGKNTGAGGDKEVWDESVLDPHVWTNYHEALMARDDAKELMKEMMK